MNRMKRIRLKVLVLAMLAVAMTLGFLTYEPPLLRNGDGAIPMRLFDVLGFAWYHNQVFWYDAVKESDKTRCAYLMSGWYRPGFLTQYLKTTLDLPALSEEFERCGRFENAARLLERFVSFGKGEADHWARLGKLQLKAERYAESIEAFHVAIQGDATSDNVFEGLARAYEKYGNSIEALRWYRKSISLNESNFNAVAGLERLEEDSQKLELRSRLEELRTREIFPQDMICEGGGPSSRGWGLWRTGGTFRSDVNLFAGQGLVRIHAKGSSAGEDWPIMHVTVDSRDLGRLRVDSATWSAVELPVDVGETRTYRITLRFINDFIDKETGEDRNLFIEKITFLQLEP